MRHWITNDGELTGNWLDEYISELSENLYGMAETNRLREILPDKYIKDRKYFGRSNKKEAKELLIELIYVIFKDRKELNSHYKLYNKQVKEDTL